MSVGSVLTPLDMTVPAADGVLLKGTLRYPGRLPHGGYPLAVLAHQYPGTRDSFAPLLADLAELGVASLAFDQRGHGASIQSPNGLVVIDTPAEPGLDAFGKAFVSSATKVGFRHIEDDVVRVTGWGVSQNFIDGGRILLVGGSVGGSGVLLAAPRLAGLAGVVTVGAAGALAIGPDAPSRIRAAVEGLKVPVLLASSHGDPFAGAANAAEWSHDLAHARAVIVPGTGHAMAIYFDVRDEVLGLVRRVLEL